MGSKRINVKNNKKYFIRPDGFTLIEVLITVTILATLTLLVARTTQQGLRAKVKMQNQIDEVSKIRDALKLMEKDIALAYHYTDYHKEIAAIIKKKSKPQNQLPPGAPPTPEQLQANVPELPPESPPIDPTTNFIGDSESMSFPTMNNARMIKNAIQADFITIGYSMKECKSFSENKKSGKCLWRRFSPDVGPDPSKGGEEVVLLEGLTEFELRYIGKGKEDWVNDWRTDARGDGATKGRFPEAVEISLTVENHSEGKDRKYSMQIVAPVHFPNNMEAINEGQ